MTLSATFDSVDVNEMSQIFIEVTNSTRLGQRWHVRSRTPNLRNLNKKLVQYKALPRHRNGNWLKAQVPALLIVCKVLIFQNRGKMQYCAHFKG